MQVREGGAKTMKNVIIKKMWDGFNTIRNLSYNVQNISNNVLMLHVTHFDPEKPESEGIYKHGIPAPSHKNKRIFGMNEIRRAARR